jgi:hypothetical protein
MKINRLDAHDRLGYFTSQSFDIAENVQFLINSKPFGDYPFYLFAHTRTADDGVTKRLIWQPRLTRPKSQTNSMLFKVDPKSDIVKIIWMIPPREQWNMFTKGKLTENETVAQSIHEFQNHRDKLDTPDPEDFSDEKIDQIYLEISKEANRLKGKHEMV